MPLFNAINPVPQQHVLINLDDTLGSTAIVIDRETGELVESTAYLANGATESDYRADRWKGLREDYRFTGKEEDVEVGLQYFGKRFLSPYIGRWVSADPLGVQVPERGDWNLYAYVHGRLLQAIDPMGLEDRATIIIGVDVLHPDARLGANNITYLSREFAKQTSASTPGYYRMQRGEDSGTTNFTRNAGIGATNNRRALVDATVAAAKELGQFQADTRRVTWGGVGHGIAGDKKGSVQPTFDMGPAGRQNSDQRISLADLKSVESVLKAEADPSLRLDRVPDQKIRELAAEMKEMRAAFEENGIKELAIEACRFANGESGQKVVNTLSRILSTEKNHLRVGGFSDYVRAVQPPGSNTVQMGTSTGRDDKSDRWQNTSTERMPEPQVWSD
jgi:RHS repeat-associated protein